MNQTERRIYLIKKLLSERPEYADMQGPANTQEQKKLLRSLFNIRMPEPVSQEFLKVQDEYLQEVNLKKGITDIAALQPVSNDIYLWQGDITTLKCDTVVNAANSQMLGCFCPCHGCIDNAIHTFAGIQLRLKCSEIMQKQGYEEPVGKAKITPAYNLPCQYVIHTVGPYIDGTPKQNDKKLLACCYEECLKIADKNKLRSIAFCCISTGEFHFPNDKAAKIAVNSVKKYKQKTGSKIKVIFNVFKKLDLYIYQELLKQY